MKKLSVQFAALIFISGVFLFGMMHLAIAITSSQDFHGFMFTLTNINGWIPYIMSLVFMLYGCFVIFNEMLNERDLEEKNKEILVENKE